MKTNILKYYIAAFYICSTFVTFAQPGAEDNGTGLEGSDPAPAPIDNYVWLLAAIGIIYVFAQARTRAKKENTPKG